MTILIKLILAHLIGDFLLQSDHLCKLKYDRQISRRLIGLGIHSAIQALLSYIFIAEWSLWIIPVVVFISHFAIDFIKTQFDGHKLPSFIIDQFAHYLAIIMIWAYLYEFPHCSSVDESNFSLWLMLTSYIFILTPTSILIKLFMEYEQWNPVDPSLRGMPNAGKWIGYLERILILTFIYTGNIAGIGFLLAAKSVFRFGELNRAKDIRVTEYVMIGTFTSFTIAILLGFGVRYFTI